MKKIVLTLLAVSAIFAKIHALDIGFVNFKKCVENTKVGQQERDTFESLKNQMGKTLEKTDKELAELAKNLEDPDYLETLSPSAKEELQKKFQMLSQEFAHYQNQYYQVLNQANYQMLQTLQNQVGEASECVREKHQLALILGEDSTFAFLSSLDYTDEVVQEMNRRFESKQAEK